MDIEPKLAAGLAKAGVVTAQRHLFLCLGPDCCTPAVGEQTWEYIKRRLKETGLPAMRTKAACLRICTAGPVLVVYPEGTWYTGVTPERFERILQDHLLGGTAVAEWVVATNSLACANPNSARST